MLQEVPVPLADIPVPPWVEELAEAGLRRSKSIACFDFVPSSHRLVYQLLQQLPRGSWCEWGSGVGINTAIAAASGFRATGIEIDPRLAAAAGELLAERGLSATILVGDYFEVAVQADWYFVYCWPGQMLQVEEHFVRTAPDAASLLICHGAEDVRRKVKRRG